MNRKETTPLYRKITDDLKTAIEKGSYSKGDLLPSENDLCKTYNTTRATIRQALGALMISGHITRKHGKGSIVAEPKNGLGILSLKGFTAGIGNKPLSTVILQKPSKQAWSEDFYYALEEDELAAGCIFFVRLRYLDQKPLLYEETHITNLNLPHFTSRNLENRSLFRILEENYQVKVKEGEQKIWAINGNEPVSKLLNVTSGHPLVHMKRRLQTNIRNLNIYSSLYCNTEEYFLQDYF
ncbi:GntR family transcriptional regulator [Pedobacter sp. JY14-1]|uniref:GntR family transcriptional regulator n=1 Tax=Pedobacter sp. JY14-1 TaxID=3034151 RepID=UPI0023E25E25|nr:GntR family transcriptional regulator [Pedobacter sp. JY14-1]